MRLMSRRRYSMKAANSNEVLPTMPIPQKPVDTDPFDYPDPNK